MRLVAEGTIPIDSVVTLVILRLLSHLDIIAPLAVYIAMLLVLGRWAKDREIVVFLAAGLGLRNFLKPTIYLSIVLGLIVGGFSLYLSPLAVRSGDDVEHEFRNRSDVSGVMTGVFTENLGGDGVYFIENYDPIEDAYQNFFAWIPSRAGDGIVTASTAIMVLADDNGRNYLELKDGVRYDGRAGQKSFQTATFKQYRLFLGDSLPPQARSRLEGWGIQKLWAQTLLLRQMPSSVAVQKELLHYYSEFHWRASKIVMLPVLMLMALALGYSDHQQNRIRKMIVALVVYFAYANLCGYLIAFSRRGHAEPLVLLWVLHFIVAIVGLYFLWCRSRNQAFFPTGQQDSKSSRAIT